MEQPIHPESPELTQFREDFTAALTDTVDFLGCDEDEFFLPVRPADLGMPDERGYEELTGDERMIISDVVSQTLGCDEMQPAAERYRIHSDERDEDIEVQILHTNRSEEGIFLHKHIYPDGSIMFVLAPRNARLL